MSLADEDPEDAKDAYGVFYRRHAGWLLRIIGSRAQLVRSLGGEAGTFDLVQDTFMRAFEKASTFDPGGVTEAERARRRVRAWLARIATNLHLDDIRAGSNPGTEPTVPLEELLGVEAVKSEEQAADPHAEQLREAIEELPDKDQDILWTWAEFYKPGAQHQRLPDEASQALAARWDTTPEAIRQQRRRLFERLRKLLVH